MSEVVVTHSPRYLIDMNLEKGKTIFDKIEIPYDTLRKKDNPIKPIVEYYKNKLKPGEDLWWIEQENVNSNNLVIKIWNNLSSTEKNAIKNKAMIFFPEIFNKSSVKFGRFAIWLITRESVVCPNIRDMFTAGGKGDITIGENIYHDAPKIYRNLFKNLNSIIEALMSTTSAELSEYWEFQTSEENKISDWIELVNKQSIKNSDAKHLNIKEMLNIAL